jgi:hypothetical protein
MLVFKFSLESPFTSTINPMIIGFLMRFNIPGKENCILGDSKTAGFSNPSFFAFQLTP